MQKNDFLLLKKLKNTESAQLWFLIPYSLGILGILLVSFCILLFSGLYSEVTDQINQITSVKEPFTCFFHKNIPYFQSIYFQSCPLQSAFPSET